jgi:hypothetical protein
VGQNLLNIFHIGWPCSISRQTILTIVKPCAFSIGIVYS